MCPLYPSGRVLIERAPIPARSVGGPIEQGTEIVVVGGDRFSLFVQAYDSSQPVTSLSDFGREILMGREDATFQAELFAESRRIEAAEHQRTVRRLMMVSAVSGLVIGLGLVAIEVARHGYTDSLLWIPLISSFSWFGIIFLACIFGIATENLMVFVSIPTAFVGLMIGMWLGGPFVAIALSFLIGVTVTGFALLIEAMRHPIV